MKQHELRQPLIKSAIVIVVIFLLIAFVAGSDASGYFGGIASIFKGVFTSILFAIALIISIIVSLALLIATFFGAVALYSRETSKELYAKFKASLTSLIYNLPFCSSCNTADTPIVLSSINEMHAEAQTNEDTTRQTRSETNNEYTAQKIDKINEVIKSLQDNHQNMASSLNLVQEKLDDTTANDSFNERADKLESLQEKFTSDLATEKAKFEKLDADFSTFKLSSDKLNDTIKGLHEQLASVSEDLQLFKQSEKEIAPTTPPQKSVPATEHDEHRILTYLEKAKDKDKFTELINEAVTNDMTYAEIDAFLKKSISKGLFETIQSHPSLKKSYIQEIRKNK